MELHDLIRHEWREDHILSRRSLIWIHEHAEAGDTNPVITAIAQLRAEGVDRLDAAPLMLPEVAPAPIRLV